jgi:D-glycero-D-manno-heptose 1,7-bisphosphate phosphatase
MKCVFLDRDGTLIRHSPYLCDPAGVEVLPSVIAGLTELRAAGCKLFLHTNQSGIGRGYFPLAAAVACNEAMLSQIGLGAGLFEDIRICPESPEEPSVCRKPSPNYALEIIARYGIGRDDVCYVGDNISDLQTAQNVGCLGVGVNSGVHDLRQAVRAYGLERFPVCDNFIEAARHVVDGFGLPHAGD